MARQQKVNRPKGTEKLSWSDLLKKLSVSTLRAFKPSLRNLIVKSWRNKSERRWERGMLVPLTYGVAVCLRGRVVRNYVPSELIYRYEREGR